MCRADPCSCLDGDYLPERFGNHVAVADGEYPRDQHERGCVASVHLRRYSCDRKISSRMLPLVTILALADRRRVNARSAGNSEYRMMRYSPVSASVRSRNPRKYVKNSKNLLPNSFFNAACDQTSANLSGGSTKIGQRWYAPTINRTPIMPTRRTATIPTQSARSGPYELI
jgi:hypothetical protein